MRIPAPSSLLVALSLTACAWAQAGGQVLDPELQTLGDHVPALAKLTLPNMRQLAKAQDYRHQKMRVSAWQTLAFAGSGSGLRHGQFKDATKLLVRWLRHRQAEDGTFVSDVDDDEDRERRDHLLSTVAIARIAVDSQYKLLTKNTRLGIDATLEQYRDDSPITDEDVALLAVLAATLRRGNWQPQHKQVLELTRSCAAVLPENKSRRTDAVRHLVDMVSGNMFPADLTDARCWPGDLAQDPLHTFVAAFALRDLPTVIRKRHWPQVERLLAARDNSGNWPAAGGFDQHTTTAILTSAVGMLYRDLGDVR